MLPYELGEMKGLDGSTLKHELEVIATRYTDLVMQAVTSHSVYKKLSKDMNSERLGLYYRFIIKEEIYPYIRQACVIAWYKRNGKKVPPKEDIVLLPGTGLFKELASVWCISEANVKIVHPLCYLFIVFGDVYYREFYLKKIRKEFKGRLGRIKKSIDRLTKVVPFNTKPSADGMIACHYSEGVDPAKRNDLNWYRPSIKPDRVLIYFDNRRVDVNRLITKDIVQQIEKQGFKWVALEDIVEGRPGAYWQPRERTGFIIEEETPSNRSGTWISGIAKKLIEDVHYWRSFYNEFNVLINYVPEEGFSDNIAQAIAFDARNNKQGLVVGRQRSEIFFPLWYDSVGFHPKHVFFVWSKRAFNYIMNHDNMDMIIISGYPHRILGKEDNTVTDLMPEGVNFVVALFDNIRGPHTIYSSANMEMFYRSFFEWVIKDPTVGVVIKSKAAVIFDNFSAIRSDFKKAVATGRCIRITDERGKFPSNASLGCDMAVGIGISSALMESVISGCRGIHYDVATMKNHEFYKWGYEQVIFDSLNRMIDSIKRYKEDRAAIPSLGDWSSYKDKIDPFFDGKGAERMGLYIESLLDSLSEGKSRHEAIDFANRMYSAEWGKEKIIVPDCESEGVAESIVNDRFSGDLYNVCTKL